VNIDPCSSYNYDANPELPIDGISSDIIRTTDGFLDKLNFRGRFQAEVWRKGVHIGNLDFKNGITNAGITDALGVLFHADTQKTTWYMLLISATSYTGVNAADTSASHAGWSESSAYDEATRPQWTAGAAAAKAITNSTPVTFTISVDNTILKGIGIISNNTKGGTTGVLWSTGLFASDQTFLDDDQLKVTYTVNGA
jgi:hypothetical protein